VGVSLQELAPCTEAQKCPSVSPLPATLTHSVSRKSFPCHSYANTRDRGATPPPKFFSPLATRHSPLALTPFRINTCKSVSKQTTLTSFRINTYEKHRGGGPLSPTTHRPLPTLPTLRLVRVAMGGLELGDLAKGKSRKLSVAEMAAVESWKRTR
jgi:hypothetical protein